MTTSSPEENDSPGHGSREAGNRAVGSREAGSDSEQFWESHYQQHSGFGSGRPNPVLVDVAGPLQPGAALDLGCGPGSDAIWLAERGWHVTAVDVSDTVLSRAAAAAAAAGLDGLTDCRQHDLARTFPAGAFDLVSAQYLHSPVEGFPRERVLQAAAHAVAPGGLLLVVAHASIPPWSWADPDTRFPTPDQAYAALELPPEQWRTELLGAPQRQATGPDGQCAAVTETVIAVRRLTP